MGQRPITIRIKVPRTDVEPEEYVVVGVSEAARRLAVSERTVYRMLKSGELVRSESSDIADGIGSVMSDSDKMNEIGFKAKSSVRMSLLSDNTDVNGRKKFVSNVEQLQAQLAAKDAQIEQLLAVQQDLTRTVQRLQEQMYELAHLVLTHNVAAAQAKAEAELKAQQEQAKGRNGLAALFTSRGRKR